MLPAVVGFTRDRGDHSGALSLSSCSAGVVVFIVVRPGGRRVHTGSLGSLGLRPEGRRVHPGSLGYWGCALRVGGSIRQVHPGSLGSLGCLLGVVGFIQVHWGAF